MHVFGYELNLSRTAAEPTAPIKTTKKGLEIGDSGTRILSGIINEEYNPKLRGQAGIDVYDEMRKSDATVKAAILATTLPIRAAEWYIEPASDDAPDQEIADFVQKAMFEWQALDWEDLLRQALLSLPFGFMVFEKVFTTRQEGGKTYIVWSKIAPRMPRSIYKWAIENDQPGVTQFRSDGTTVEIPMEKLIVVVNEMEGDNWDGTSILRAAYKHWFIKNNFYKIDAIAFERQGLGVPYAKLPENYTETDRAKAETILKNLRANSQAFIVEPHDYEIGFKDMMAKTTRDPESSISHHNREILKAVLAQFLELGGGAKGASGSRAVSQDHSDLFLQSLEAVADGVAIAFNKGIKELVDLNFDNVGKYPTLTYEGITDTDVAKLSGAYQTLTTTGAIIPSDNDEQYFRKLLSLPERDPNEEGRTLPVKTDPSKPDPTAPAADQALEGQDAAEMSELVSWLKKNSDRQSFAEDDTFKPYRKLTFAEGKVDFEALQRQMDKLEAEFDARTKALLHEARNSYMKALTKAAHAGDTAAIKDATLKVQADLARIIKQGMTTAYTYGKANAAKEMGVEAPANPMDILRQIDIQADTIADKQIAEITGDSKNAYVQALNKGTSVTVALAAADAAAQAAIDALTSDASAILMAGYINHGRNTVFTNNAPDIHGLQRSEILDSHTCNFCLSVDGRIVATDDSFAQNTIFHSSCRGIWVAIKNDEAELPPIGGIPKAVRDRFGDAVNDLIQPKKPMVRKDAPAAKEAQRRIDKQAADPTQ
ncbi:MAG: hypothetical protein BGO51_15545 [Rhodospirillales bacterium 69-11]|nr:MAG: hypothetical protein BGO51_15545 [Rhodospirillales bacterium 69-11]